MKILYNNKKDKIKRLQEYIITNEVGDYIYDYPPRQAYRSLKNVPWELIEQSLNESDEINLYFHFPFCRQICSFCNLFTISDISLARFAEYFTVLEKEFDYYSNLIKGKKVNTIYLGGGTPSWIPASYFESFFQHIEKSLEIKISDIEEVSIELSPDTASFQHLIEYKNIGINRVNIGVQAFDNEELSCIGRQYDVRYLRNQIKDIMRIGFKNVCVDLIYGLETQTMDTWRTSLKMAIEYHPQTICPYPLTLRPKTGFEKHGYTQIDGQEQYKKYLYAHDFLCDNGYEQETHVRYKMNNSTGGYIQKENHWKQQNILGFGAGARSYLKYINYRNGYSVINRKKAYQDYICRIGSNSMSIVDGFVMNADEIIRKEIILGINGLNRQVFSSRYHLSPEDVFPVEFDFLFKEGYIENKSSCIYLTNKGMMYRDLIVQIFFSDNVNHLVNSHSYKE